MSTYGKKSLNWWNYEYASGDLLRYNKTDKDFQLQILEKWYPIGMKCSKRSSYAYSFLGDLTVIRYVETLYNWEVQVLDTKNYTSQVNPCLLIPKEDWLKAFLREKRLTKFFNI